MLTNVTRQIPGLFFFLFIVTHLAASDIPWRGLSPSATHDFYLVEDFENKVPWVVKSKFSISSYGRLIEKEPLYPGTKNSYKQQTMAMFNIDLDFAKRSAARHNRLIASEARYSLEMQTFFRNMGQDIFEFHPRPRVSDTRINGRPRAISLWVFGKSKKHTLYALLGNSRGKVYPIKMGSLDFYGWERLEKTIPAYVQRRNPGNSNQYDFSFHGLRIVSSTREEPGLFLFNFDMVMVLIDRSEENYPGSAIKDKWQN